MFELEQHVRSWGDYLRSKGMKEADVLELESHLLDQIDDLVKSGLSEEEAFIISVKRLGNVNTISEEYSKINTENLWKHLLLDPADPTAKARSRKQIALIILLSFLAGTAAKIPAMFGIQTQDVVYFKNLSFFVLPFIAFFITVKHGRVKMFWPLLAVYTTSCVVVNLLSPYRPSQTDILTGVHLPLFLWLVTGIAYTGQEWRSSKARMNFVRFTGECVIYGSLLMLGLMVLMMFTMIIFQSININMGPFVENYLVVYGGAAAALITVYLVEAKKSVVENFAPILAKIFSPVFLLTMIAFLGAMVVKRTSPFMAREFLIGFDLLLVVVLGIVLYTISARSVYDKRSIFDYLNAALIAVAIVVDCVALSAIIFRLSEFGITPNKMAALGENILLLVNLAALLVLYARYFASKIEFTLIETFQTRYLTVYAVWFAIVAFVFPIVFRVKW
ncbi:MAG: permease prefix domain 1-containing protein [Limnochordia bacterium]|jgi:hypothetical protein|nr:permease prefix domain 1-containing protein [Bacillota bacterium]HOB09370.1 permease prefix domain 1-containing protein [Limnochordia bacterium]HPT93349.1 permease prefix domain 1-containing protein [Limnochordia bacterium]HXK97527.1 permease prefix domain 1-containing protein [Limnochordia bacterium]